MEIGFDNFIGNPIIIKTVCRQLKEQTLKKQLLFSGISGVGKTTLANIVAKELDAHITLFDVANLTGIDNVRLHILEEYRKQTLSGQPQVFILDEIHKFSMPAQEALLTPLDQQTDTYFIACTTEPSKLKLTLLKRFTHFKFVKPTETERRKCISQLGLEISEEVTEHIVRIVVDLRSVTILAELCDRTTLDEARKLCAAYSEKTEAIDIVRKLSQVSLPQFFTLLKEYGKGGNWNTLLMMLINYYTVVLSKNGKHVSMSQPVMYGCEKARIYELSVKIKEELQCLE